MGVKLFLIRHGQTDGNVRGQYVGSLDIDMTEEGVAQAKSAKQYLSRVNFSNIYSSPLKRALNTARILAECTGHEVRIMNDLRELDFGKWEGLKFDEINAIYKEDYQGWLEDPYNHPPTGGESFNDLIARADKEIKKIVQENPDGSSVAVVSHGGVILSLIVNWLNIPSQRWRSLIQRQAAINVVVIDNGFPYISSINYTGHLKPIYDDSEDKVIEIYSKIKHKQQ
jgi:alpha-ribazole phosphatase